MTPEEKLMKDVASITITLLKNWIEEIEKNPQVAMKIAARIAVILIEESQDKEASK
jgi:recombinational DNA repair protein RecR